MKLNGIEAMQAASNDARSGTLMDSRVVHLAPLTVHCQSLGAVEISLANVRQAEAQIKRKRDK